MAEPYQSTSDQPRPPPALTAPVMVWTVLQLAALLLSAARVPLWARPIQPIENNALWLMLAMQFGASSMLFPWLFRDRRGGMFVCGAAMIFVHLAGLLGSNRVDETLRAMIAQLVWLIALGAWSVTLNRPFLKMFAIALASSVAIGGALVGFLAAEFQGHARLISSGIVWSVLAQIWLFR